MKINDLFDINNLEYKWDVIESIPEFAKLKECQQNPKYHAEGNAWIHTKAVCDAATRYFKTESNSTNSPDFIKKVMMAALFHDIGKGATTTFSKGGWHSYGHEIVGPGITRRILFDECIPMREDICFLVQYHMEPLRILDGKNYLEKMVTLSKTLKGLKGVYLVKMFDIEGSKRSDNEEWKDYAYLNTFLNYAKNLSAYDYPSTIPEIQYTGLASSRIPNKAPVIVYMLIGLPGSGKSTYAEAFKGREPDCIVINRDSIRSELGFCQTGKKMVGDDEQEKAVTQSESQKIRRGLETGCKLFIIDNLNLKRKYREQYKNLFQGENVVYKYVYFETENIKVNLERRKDEIGQDVFDKMIERLDWPTYIEYQTLSYCVERTYGSNYLS